MSKASTALPVPQKKRVYKSPMLLQLGDVAQLVRGATGSQDDGAGGQAKG